jgi:hypothetical protein
MILIRPQTRLFQPSLLAYGPRKSSLAAQDPIGPPRRCRYKAFLKGTDQTGSPTEYESLERRLLDAYQGKAIQQLAERYLSRGVALGPLSSEDAPKGRHRLILNLFSSSEHGSITIPAIELLVSAHQQDYAVVMLAPSQQFPAIKKARENGGCC